MSIELHEEAGGKILMVNLSGKLTKEDYGRFVPEVERWHYLTDGVRRLTVSAPSAEVSATA